MRKKLITALSLVIAFSLIFTAQMTYAEKSYHHNKPTTSPVTNPITGPITSPASVFCLSGHVIDHIFSIFKKSKDRFAPEAGAKVKAKDIFSGRSVTAVTDKDGNYKLDLDKKGFYKVTVDGDAKFYTPPFQLIQVDGKKSQKQNVDFTGYIYKY